MNLDLAPEEQRLFAEVQGLYLPLLNAGLADCSVVLMAPGEDKLKEVLPTLDSHKGQAIRALPRSRFYRYGSTGREKH